jgi:glycine/D-amino acid oxidase-like deaminating enzyme
MHRRVFLERSKQIPVTLEKDIVIGGGGPAGIAAAVAAAREGCDVVLIERYGFLTGAHASGHVGTFCGVYYVVDGKLTELVKGFVSELLHRLRDVSGLCEPVWFGRTGLVTYDPLWFKQISEELVLGAGAHLLLHSLITDVIVEGNEIRGLITESKSGRHAIMGKIFIDATGDADIAARAAAPYNLGDKGVMQFPSTNFRIANVKTEIAKDLTFADLHRKLSEVAQLGELNLPRADGYLFLTPRKGEMVCNMTTVSRKGGVLDGTKVDDLTYAEVEGRKQAREYEKFLKKYLPGFEEIFIEDAGQIGIRETRTILGDYTLTNDDVVKASKFEDAIARSAWPIELHAIDEVKLVWLDEGDFYEIPYRCLLPKGVENLLVAGRCISAEHEAQASVRVAAQCFAEGEAAGTAAAMALKAGADVREINPLELRKRLVQKGAYL